MNTSNYRDMRSQKFQHSFHDFSKCICNKLFSNDCVRKEFPAYQHLLESYSSMLPQTKAIKCIFKKIIQLKHSIIRHLTAAISVLLGAKTWRCLYSQVVPGSLISIFPHRHLLYFCLFLYIFNLLFNLYILQTLWLLFVWSKLKEYKYVFLQNETKNHSK